MGSNEGPDWLALYGAILATLVATWQGLQWWLERRRISVSCYLAKRIGNTILSSGMNIVLEGEPPAGWLPDHLLQRFIAFEIKNTGGKRVVVTTFGGHLKNGQGIVGLEGPVKLPHTLEPGDSVTLGLPLPVDIRTVMSLDHVKDLGIWDGLGRYRKARLRTLKRQYANWIRERPR